MSRYVLVSFEDNKEADMFVKCVMGQEFWENLGENPTVWGMWFKPTQFCECSPVSKSQSRGQKYGLWIDSCGKPIRGHYQYPKNLLVPDEVLKSLEPYIRSAVGINTREGIELPHLPISLRVRDNG